MSYIFVDPRNNVYFWLLVMNVTLERVTTAKWLCIVIQILSIVRCCFCYLFFFICVFIICVSSLLSVSYLFDPSTPQERDPSNVSSATSPPPRSPTFHGTNEFILERNRTAAPGATTGTGSLTRSRLVALMAATVALMIWGLIGRGRRGYGGCLCVWWWENRWYCRVVLVGRVEGVVLKLKALYVCVCALLFFYIHMAQKQGAHYNCRAQCVFWAPKGGPLMFIGTFEGQNLVLWLGLGFMLKD